MVPLAPGDSWSGDGTRSWTDLGEDEQNSHRALAPTLGNLTLLEQPLAERVFGGSFPDKRAEAYTRSAVPATAALAEYDAWGTAAISARTVALTDDLVRIWARPALPEIDDDGLTPSSTPCAGAAGPQAGTASSPTSSTAASTGRSRTSSTCSTGCSAAPGPTTVHPRSRTAHAAAARSTTTWHGTASGTSSATATSSTWAGTPTT
ncbi:HNH endonuclease family protein [Microbacterium sp. NIBRBAC000506063]|uniref:HNH endonuclease family protein n=1 Tax=Microbacterium sp. NIBRBAC000506063 TaxID=2734618 RepID=UPI0021D41C0A|nr:HNH endonuclease family protein [Microbacterium sp. NIBRBAC000506063]